jgi:glycosyltransferase involved in cell wall biosynthesis
VKQGLSIVIPTLNRREMLVQTLRSLRNCEGEVNAEVIVVDQSDVPANPFAEVALPQGWEGVYVYRTEKNVSAARNVGVALSRQPLVLFLDDDMEALPGFLRQHMEAQVFAQVALSTSAILAGHDRTTIAQDCAFYRQEEAKARWPELAEKLQGRLVYHAPSCNMCVKKTVLSTIGLFRECLSINEDSELCSRLLTAGLAQVYLEKPLLLHYQTALGGTRDGNRDYFRFSVLQKRNYCTSWFLFRLYLTRRLPALWEEFDFYLGQARSTFLNRYSLRPDVFLKSAWVYFESIGRAQRLYRENPDPPTLEQYEQIAKRESAHVVRKTF